MSEAKNVVRHPSAPAQGGLVAALIQAQRNFGRAVKDSLNPHFKSHYVDLAGCYEACEAALWDAGLTVLQWTDVDATGPVLVTELAHVSGETRQGRYPLVPNKDRDPQALGSALTYARRYSLMAMVGLAPEDDDGNAASDRGSQAPKGQSAPSAPPSAPAAPPTAPSPAVATPAQVRELQIALKPMKLGEAGADARQLRGQERDAYLREATLAWISDMVGRKVSSSKELTPAECTKLVAKAKAGEMPA